MTTTADPEAGFQAAEDPGSADPNRYVAVGSYDDLPDVAVQVVLTVPLAPPSQPPAPAPQPQARPQRSRGAHRHRTSRPRSATREAAVVGVAAAGVVFATVAVLLLLSDLLIG